MKKMGCGASSKKKKADEPAKENTEELVQPFDSSGADKSVGGAWASKTDKAAADNGMAFQIMNNPATKSKANEVKASPAGGDASGMRICDAEDDDVGDVEVINEGKGGQARKLPPAANGQEPPDDNDSDGANAAEAAAAEKAKVISTRQREEAAKLAEQRKKFDQRKMNAAGAGLAGGSSGFPATGQVTAASVDNHGNDAYDRAMVMGLNLSKVQQHTPVQEDLPGAINDTPREQQTVGKQHRNQHDRFDDDDLRLMNEILDSVDF